MSRITAASDPTLRPAYSLRNRIMRALWGVVYATLYRLSPRPMLAWWAMLLRLFGAELGAHCHFHRNARIWAPWNLHCADRVCVADGAELYNPSPLYMGSHCIVSQGAYICGATHEYNDPEFRLVHFPIRLGPYSWVCARATVNPGINLGAGAILALESVATRDLEPFGIYAGIPRARSGSGYAARCP